MVAVEEAVAVEVGEPYSRRKSVVVVAVEEVSGRLQSKPEVEEAPGYLLYC